MTKKIIVTLLITLSLFLFLGCAKQPPVTEPTIEEAPEAVEEIDEVATGISDITTVDEELDASELDDMEVILEDIENI